MPIEFRERNFRSLSPHGFHRVVYREWGDPANTRVVVCLHGLTRNGRDFDALAEELGPRWRVLCPDMPGRGKSDWLRDPHDYGFPVYLTTVTAMLAHARADEVAWVGTSMGGLLGMVMAAQPGTPVQRLVINDVGPVLEPEALTRVAGYLGLNPSFATFAALEEHIRAVSAPFGKLTDAQWEQISRSTAMQMSDGSWRLNYDPGIAVPFADGAAAVGDTWPIWDAISCPTLVLRGMESDLLSRETAAKMHERGPRPDVIEVPGVGHAPMLMNPEQIAPVAAFLDTS